MTTLTDSDEQFARLVVGQGLVQKAHVEECLTVLRTLEAHGIATRPRLGEMLVRKGYLSSAELEATIRAVGPPPNPATEAPPPPDVLEAMADPARRLGKYVKLGRLGEGGMGTVWKAWDPELRRRIALKLLKGDDPEEIARFRREAQTAAKLVHPNIAAVFEVGEHSGTPYIAMQLIEGPTLAQYLRQEKAAIASLIRDAARAVQYAHDAGIVHRDLKPLNLMVEEQGASRRVYVMDFGLAKEAVSESHLTMSGRVVGTPAYMSPEQSRGEKVDARTDVFSLGATLYHLLTGEAPFKGLTVYEILRHVQEDEPAPLRGLDPAIPRDLEVVVLKSLEKDPARRYRTAGALAEDLDRWLQGEPVQARSQSLLYRLRRRAAKSRAILSVAAAGILASLVVATMASIQPPTPPPPPPGGSILVNERRAADALRALAKAEQEFRSNDRDGNGVQDYWTGDVTGLRILLGPKDNPLELIDQVTADADVAPLGTVAAAGRYRRPERTISRTPEGGYYLRVMAKDASGGVVEPYQQDTGGTPAMGAVHHRSRFGFCAIPAEYGVTGTKTFIVNERDEVYWMDTRGSPVPVWPPAEDLGSSWTREGR